MTKLSIFRDALKAEGLSAAIIYNTVNQHYLTDFCFEDGVVLISLEDAYLVTDFRYYESAVKEADRAFKVVTLKDQPGVIDSFVSSFDKVGFESDHVSFSKYSDLKEKYPNVNFVGIDGIISNMRMVKSADEIKKMQTAQNITDKAFAHILKIITPDMTEIEVALELEYAMRKFGADSFAFSTIAVSGDASAVPHGTPRPIKLKKGFLTMDFGAKLNGYCSDMTRTVVIGKADAEIKKLYNTVLSAQLAAIDFLKAGVLAFDADKVARDIIESNPEYKGTFGHSLGHSIGMLVHEMPGLSPKSGDIRVIEGQVTSVEPGIYIFGKYGCRIEDMVNIEKNGVYNFTASTKELIEIY